MIKGGKWQISEEEFERQYLKATQRGDEMLKNEPQARLVSYDSLNHRLVIELKNGVILFIPAALLQGLTNATPQEIAQVELLPRGAALHWPTLDVQMSIAGLLTGIFGTETWQVQLNQPHGLTFIHNYGI